MLLVVQVEKMSEDRNIQKCNADVCALRLYLAQADWIQPPLSKKICPILTSPKKQRKTETSTSPLGHFLV